MPRQARHHARYVNDDQKFGGEAVSKVADISTDEESLGWVRLLFFAPQSETRASYGPKSYSCRVTDSGDEKPRLFATKNFMRFARGFGSSPKDLWDAVQAKPDADLGGGVFKFRLAREGEGTSGGARAIVAMKVGRRVVLMYGFEKKDLGNIQRTELKEFKALAKIYLGFSEEKMSELVREKVLAEIKLETKSVRETKKPN